MDTWHELTKPAPRVSTGGTFNGDVDGSGTALPAEVATRSACQISGLFCAVALTATLNH